jgi:tetratricopeptide (TPR) repeat protein
MARFEHLEFGPDANDRGQTDEPPKQQPEEDEHRALVNADDCRRRGQYENALRFYSRSLEYDKSLIAAWVGQVQMLVQLGEAPEAELWARKALEMFPGNGELLAARAQALCRIGDLPQAGAACDSAMGAAGRSAFRWQVRGEWMLACRQKLEEHCFAKAQEIDGNWLVAMESALIYLHYKFPSRAVMRARLATELAPAEYHPWFVRGTAEAELGLRQAAIESFDQCLQLCPRHVEALARRRELSAGWSASTVWRACRNFLGRR